MLLRDFLLAALEGRLVVAQVETQGPLLALLVVKCEEVARVEAHRLVTLVAGDLSRFEAARAELQRLLLLALADSGELDAAYSEAEPVHSGLRRRRVR